MSTIFSCTKCDKTFTTKQNRDYHINHNSCKNQPENANISSLEGEIKELKRMMILMLKNVEELKTEIKELKSLPQHKEVKEEKKEEKKEIKEVKEEKKEVKEIKEEKKEVKKEEKEDLSMFETRADGFTHIGNLSVSRMKAIKDNFLKTGKAVLPEKDFKNTPENMDRVKLYLGIPIKKKQEEKKEEPEPQPKEEDEEEEDETDEDKAFGEYCDKDEYGVYHIGGIQSDSLTRLKEFYAKIPKDLLFGERKTKCNDKMDYLKREFASKFSNDFSGSKDDYNKLKFYLEN